MWTIQDRREYDEPTVLNWIANERPRDSSSSGGRGGYPTVVGGAAAISGSAVDMVRFLVLLSSDRSYPAALKGCVRLYLPSACEIFGFALIGPLLSCGFERVPTRLPTSECPWPFACLGLCMQAPWPGGNTACRSRLLSCLESWRNTRFQDSAEHTRAACTRPPTNAESPYTKVGKPCTVGTATCVHPRHEPSFHFTSDACFRHPKAPNISRQRAFSPTNATFRARARQAIRSTGAEM